MMIGFAVGPLLLNLGEPTTYAMFLLPAAIMAAAVFPVWAAGGAAPAITAPQRASVLTIIKLAPTGMIGSVLIGMAHGGLVGMGAVYGKRIGLSKAHVALFLFAAYIGAVVTQVPLGWLYDHRSRRAVLGGVCAAIAGLAAVAALAPMTGAFGVVLMGAIGGLVFPLYGLTNAYVNHHVPDELRGAASGAFVQVCGVGAVAGPVTFALMMGAVGASGYFWMMVLAHVLLGGFIVVRVVVDRRAAPVPALADSAVG
jgi:MFS family permease